jgi:hypothetical protein
MPGAELSVVVVVFEAAVARMVNMTQRLSELVDRCLRARSPIRSRETLLAAPQSATQE